VLDSFALIAFVQNEPGAERVEELLNNAATGDSELYISAVNLGEVFYTISNRQGTQSAVTVLSGIDQSPIQIVDVDRELALSAARIKARTGMGYADCFVAALAQRMSATVLTGDPDFEEMAGSVDIEWLPE
jgi:ribonuclease VapC